MRYIVTLNGKKYEVEVDGASAIVNPDEQTVVSAPVRASEQAQQKGEDASPESTDGTPVKAPLPGKIMDVKVSVGQRVKADDTIIILEAMKMENEIKAGMAGVVSGLSVTKGSSVNTGDVLAVIK